MRQLLFSVLAFIPLFVQGQNKLDSLIDVGNNLYEHGEKEKALEIYKRILSSCPDTSSTYGITLQNILWYYIEEDNEKKLLEYYQKLMSSKLKEKEINKQFGAFVDPFRNYRYHSTRNLAAYFAKKKQFSTSLKYITFADNNLVYETTSLTSFIFQKVDLAFWKARLYRDLGKKDSALYVLIKRAFEYDYSKIYPNWATLSASNDEKELSDEIIKHFPSRDSLKLFIADVNMSFDNLLFEHDQVTKIKLTIQKKDYEIVVHDILKSAQECKEFLKHSFFYGYILELDKQNSR